jgi:DNA-directed RNA polymerase subunit K/omega
MVKEKKTLFNKTKNITIENIINDENFNQSGGAKKKLNNKKNKDYDEEFEDNDDEEQSEDVNDQESDEDNDNQDDDDDDDDDDQDEDNDDNQDDDAQSDDNDAEDDNNIEDDDDNKSKDEDDMDYYDEIKDNYIENENSLNKKCVTKYLNTLEEDLDEILLDDNTKFTTNVRVSKPFLSKYERVRIISTRTKQLLQGSKPMIKNCHGLSSKEIALLELENKVIPLIIERPIPNSAPERWKLSELEIL